MFKPVDFYIDLGTANTLIYAKKRGFLLNQPSVIVLKNKGSRPQELFALGEPAKTMLGKNPQSLFVSRPLREGVIADFDNTAKMLHAFIKRVKENIYWIKPRMIISLPCKVTNFEKRAVEEVGYSLGARKVHLLDEPVAAAIGAGLSVLSPRGQMIIDIGGGTTEIALISSGGIVASSAVRIGGNNLDDAIGNYLRSHFQFWVGEQTQELIKISVANANPNTKQNLKVEAGGMDMIKGLPKKMTVDTKMIFQVVDGVIKEIIYAVRKTLENCPPEIAGDICETGIVIAGGGALLKGLKERLEMEFKIPIRISEHPLLSVAIGGAKALEDSNLFDAIERPA